MQIERRSTSLQGGLSKNSRVMMKKNGSISGAPEERKGGGGVTCENGPTGPNPMHSCCKLCHGTVFGLSTKRGQPQGGCGGSCCACTAPCAPPTLWLGVKVGLGRLPKKCHATLSRCQPGIRRRAFFAQECSAEHSEHRHGQCSEHSPLAALHAWLSICETDDECGKTCQPHSTALCNYWKLIIDYAQPPMHLLPSLFCPPPFLFMGRRSHKSQVTQVNKCSTHHSQCGATHRPMP